MRNRKTYGFYTSRSDQIVTSPELSELYGRSVLVLPTFLRLWALCIPFTERDHHHYNQSKHSASRSSSYCFTSRLHGTPHSLAFGVVFYNCRLWLANVDHARLWNIHDVCKKSSYWTRQTWMHATIWLCPIDGSLYFVERTFLLLPRCFTGCVLHFTVSLAKD